jgi:FeS assembly SUF system protein
MMFWKKKTPMENESVQETAPETIAAPVSEPVAETVAAHEPIPVPAHREVTIREPVVAKTPVETEVSSSENIAGPEIDIAEAQFEGKVIEAISTVFDPEIPVNIYELGLIYNIDINGMKDVRIDMTLTSPACPVAGTLPGDVERVVQTVEGIGGVAVELVWEPSWTPDRMSEAAKLELGFM